MSRVVVDSSESQPDLSIDQYERFCSYGTAVRVEAGEELVRTGDAGYDLLLLDDAAVELFAAGTQILEVSGRGRFVGELSLLTGQFAPLTVRVVRGGQVYRVNPQRLRSLMDRDPELSDVVLRAFVARRRQMHQNAAARSLQIVGSRMSAPSMALRRYAARLELAHEWIEADTAAGRALVETGRLTEAQLPVVFLRDTTLVRATPGELADALGLVFHQLAHDVLDLVVVGSGPAGLAAAVYGASEGLDTLAVDSVAEGGQAANSSRIENYLGFVSGVSGADLTGRAAIQALKFGAKLSSPCAVTELRTDSDHLVLTLGTGERIATRSVIVATGARYRRLPIDRWEHFEGAGIFYAATALETRACGASPVAVIGGANSAGQAALYLAEHGASVTLVIRGSRLEKDMSSYLADRVTADPRITVALNTQVTDLDGDTALTAITLTGPRGVVHQPCAGLFCFIGAVPASDWLTDVLLDERGFVRTDVALTDEELGETWASLDRRPLPFETSVPGVFAAGDVRAGSMKRVAAAVGEGSSAIRSVHAVVDGLS